MVANRKTLYEQALTLSASDREALAEELYRSLHEAQADEIEKAWAAEAHRRLDELDKGKSKPVPIEQVFPDWKNPA